MSGTNQLSNYNSNSGKGNAKQQQQGKYNDKDHFGNNDILDIVNGTDIHELIRIDDSSDDTGSAAAHMTTQDKISHKRREVNKLPSLPRPLTLVM